MRIAVLGELSFEVPENSWWSFYNSPYPAHRLGTALDVYFPEEALYPLEGGIVVDTRKVRTPSYIPVREDYLTVIRANGVCLKVLHVRPAVRKGERLTLGDPIGEMVASGFFSPWSNRHAHFELRPCEDAFRARGAFSLRSLIHPLVLSAKGDEFEVVECHGHYCWARPVKRGEPSLTPLLSRGTPLEGGLPHYRYGALFGKTGKVSIFGLELPVVDRLSNGVSIFETNFKVLADGREIRGIGAYCNNPLIKLVGTFEEGEVVKIAFERNQKKGS
ncbi:hypothetical protein [Palaeococcus ferrophilus]|uniref:hypothetical protein n=1 Tax=Palaeococcus ferrophilus TaxID=83868 RepID=UPI00064FC505|nr:hypothetical protein [Palaeococcus ferrophilus]